MIGLIERLRSALPWVKPAPVDPDSLGAILADALEAAARERATPPPPAPLHRYRASVCDIRMIDAVGFHGVCLGKVFCDEMAARGFDPVAVWDVLASLPDDSLDDLYSPEGWATLSAYASGGAVVLRVEADKPHGDITRLALSFAHDFACRSNMTPGQIYDALLALDDGTLHLLTRRANWPELEDALARGGGRVRWSVD